MARIQRTVYVEMKSNQRAIAAGKTGDIIHLGTAPPGIENGVNFAHATGLMTHTQDKLYLNGVRVCNTDRPETHGSKYCPFHNGIIMVRLNGGMHEFCYILPSANPDTVVPTPAFRYKADELEVVPLISGKGLILIEKKPDNRIVLLNKFRLTRFIRGQWNKVSQTDIAWEGPHQVYVETPNSVIIGKKIQMTGEVPFTRFYRGHDHDQVYDHLGESFPICWATDDDFFFEKDILGEKVMVSTKTGTPTVYRKDDELYVTSEALVRRKDSIVQANGVTVNDSFVVDQILPVAHASGLIYVHCGEIRMLIIKNVPEQQVTSLVSPNPSQ